MVNLWRTLVKAGLGGSDACPTGDEEVRGLAPTGSAVLFCEIDHEYFLWSFSPFC